MLNKDRIRKELDNVGLTCSVKIIAYCKGSPYAELRFLYMPLTFSFLEKVSQVLGTKNINIESEIEYGYYDSVKSDLVLEVRDIDPQFED